MLLGGGKPGQRIVLLTVFLFGLTVAFWRLCHSNYMDVNPGGWLRNPKHIFAGLGRLRFRKTIVMASLAHDNTRWVEKELPDWERAIYVTDVDASHARGLLTVPQNKGNEANVYLWHILQNYDNLPDLLVFLHSHRDGASSGWHIDNEEQSNPLSIQRLNLDTVSREGFVNLRCIPIPGCDEAMYPDWNETGDVRLPEVVKTVDVLPAAFDTMFPFGLDTLNATANYTTATEAMRPDIIAAPCCAQFAVTRAQVLQRPKSDYERYHRWLMATELDNYLSGRIMEYLWHIIFGRPAYYCPDMNECYRALYTVNPAS